MAVVIRPLAPLDLEWLEMEPKQALWLAAAGWNLDEDYAGHLLSAGPAYAVLGEGRLLMAAGFALKNPHYAECWALMGRPGRHHLAMTRAVRAHIAAAPYRRMEALVRTDHPQAGRWALLLGFHAGPLLRCAAPDGHDFQMMEIVDG